MEHVLKIMVAVAASGKTTYINMNKGEEDFVIHRDNVREFVVGNREWNTKIEKEVYRVFIDSINTALSYGYPSIWVDQTSLTKKVRNKLLSNLNMNLVDKIEIYYLSNTLEDCLYNNCVLRGGTKGEIPNKAIISQYQSLEVPTYEEFEKWGKPVEIHYLKGYNHES